MRSVGWGAGEGAAAGGAGAGVAAGTGVAAGGVTAGAGVAEAGVAAGAVGLAAVGTGVGDCPKAVAAAIQRMAPTAAEGTPLNVDFPGPGAGKAAAGTPVLSAGSSRRVSQRPQTLSCSRRKGRTGKEKEVGGRT